MPKHVKYVVDLERVRELSQGNIDIKVSLAEKTVKLFEETGEFAEAMEAVLNISPENYDNDELLLKLVTEILEEGCDSLNVLLDILFALGISNEDIKDILYPDLTLEQHSPERVMLKLYAVGGRFAQMMLKANGSKNVSASAKNTNEEILALSGEITGIIFFMISMLELGEEAFENMFNKKLDKWEMKVGMAKRGEI